MIAIDTNVLVRFVLRDDPAQFEKAAEVMAMPSVLVPSTVVLETEWVLRKVFDYPAAAVAETFSDLLALPNVVVQEESRVVAAIALARKGMDFADAMHLAGAGDADEFVTFDRDMVRSGARARSTPPVRLL